MMNVNFMVACDDHEDEGTEGDKDEEKKKMNKTNEYED